jgi:4-amino-4-deoxy-L-arabinose transferase-like glycosyltransferase
MSSQPMRRCESLLLLAILACGLGLRLIEICQPFIDAWSWREADMAMIAENFYRYGFHIFYPQVNWAGNAPGYVGTEFPLVSFLAACLYSVFGVQDWIGRSISVLFYAVSLLFLYFLVRKVSNVRSALLAVAIYTLTPLSIFAGRAFMPDMATLSLSIMALYLFAEWLERQPHTPLFIAVSLATCLALLVKLPSILIGIPMLYMAWEKYGARWVRQRELWAFAAFALAGPLVWYTHAYSISISHAPYHFFGSGGITIESLDWYIGVFYRTVATGLTPIVVVAMLVGIMVPLRVQFGKVFHWWLLANLMFMVVVGEGNRHPWYQLPMAPVAAALAGMGYDFTVRRSTALMRSKTLLTLLSCLFFAALAAFSYMAVAPLYAHQRPELWSVGRELNRITPPDALVIVADDGDPRAIYYSQRKGWHFLQDGYLKDHPRNTQEAITIIEQLRGEGASYLAFAQNIVKYFDAYEGLREYLDVRYQRIRETTEYVIFDITTSKLEEMSSPPS